jgi:predicted amidohydrolase
MSRTIVASSVQLPAEVAGRGFAGKQKENLRLMVEALEEAGKRRSDIVLLGEYANLHHRSCSRNRKEYVPERIPGPFTRAASRVARRRKMNVVLPVFGTWEGRLSSHAVLLDRAGRVAGCYTKSHPTEEEQRLGITAGNDLPVFPLDCCRVGIMICMDIEYPEVAQVLMLRGAELLLFPHVQASWGEVDWEIRYRARAVDTGLPVVSACYGFPEGTWAPGKMLGRSSIVGRDGLIMADQGRGIGIVTRSLDVGTERVTHFFFDRPYGRTTAVAASRRPALYHSLIDERPGREARRRLGRKP